jgi:hypothetical protein
VPEITFGRGRTTNVAAGFHAALADAMVQDELDRWIAEVDPYDDFPWWQ